MMTRERIDYSFGGSFQPIIGGPDIAETETPSATVETERPDRQARFVNRRQTS